MIAERHHEIMKAFADAHSAERPPPTHKELATALGLNSTGTISEHLDNMKLAGLLETIDGVETRNWRLTDRGKRLLGKLEERARRQRRQAP